MLINRLYYAIRAQGPLWLPNFIMCVCMCFIPWRALLGCKMNALFPASHLTFQEERNGVEKGRKHVLSYKTLMSALISTSLAGGMSPDLHVRWMSIFLVRSFRLMLTPIITSFFSILFSWTFYIFNLLFFYYYLLYFSFIFLLFHNVTFSVFLWGYWRWLFWSWLDFHRHMIRRKHWRMNH